jgi:hypothetical protein
VAVPCDPRVLWTPSKGAHGKSSVISSGKLI